MTLGIGLGLVFGLGWIPLFIFRAEALTQALQCYTPRERLWVTLTPAVLAVHVTAVCLVLNLTSRIPWLSAVVGLAVFGSALAFGFWGRWMIGPLRLHRLPDDPPLQFQCSGAFGIVRHPLYCSYLVAAAAPLTVVPRPLFVLTFAVCCIALMVRTVQEERRIRAQVGAPYDAYCREVKRLIPFVW